MTTWTEARAARAERLRREQRHYKPEHMGPKCAVCKKPMVKALVDADGDTTHMTCDPSYAALR